jgi:hypothetical protein
MHLPSKGVQKLSKRMAMQSKYNGSLQGLRAKETVRIAGRGGGEESRGQNEFRFIGILKAPAKKGENVRLPPNRLRGESTDRL